MDFLDAANGGMNVGALGSVLGRNREQKIADRAEAVRQGQSVENTAELESRVRGVAEDFVSVFMNQVMKSMRATVHENPAMHGDNGEKFFQEMLDTEQSKFLAKGSGYGLTDLIYESMMSSYRVREQAEANGVNPAAGAAAAEDEALHDADAEAAADPELSVEAIA